MFVRGYTSEDYVGIGEAQSLSQLFVVAHRILCRLPQPVTQVCGPITTGGFGSIEKNLRMLEFVYEVFAANGRSVFNVLPYETVIPKLSKFKFGYKEDVLSDFYLPIFESGVIARMCFIPGWRESRGATWERWQAVRLGIAIEELPTQTYDLMRALLLEG